MTLPFGMWFLMRNLLSFELVFPFSSLFSPFPFSSLTAFKIFCACLVCLGLIMMCFMSRKCLGLFYLGVCEASEICRFTSFVKFRNSWTFHSLFSSPFDSLKTWTLGLLLLSHRSLMLVFFSPVYFLSVVQIG